MARVPEAELERLKREISVERLAEARGVKLERRGQDLHGLCPFHDDKSPSLVISPKKNLWNCLGACQSGGSVIDWVMKAEGVSFRHAVELLREGAPPSADGAAGAAKPPPARSRQHKLPPPVSLDADDRALLRQVVGYYQQTLLDSPEALAYLDQRGIGDEEAIKHFQLGFANRTLGLRLPNKEKKAGRAVRGRLQALGIIRQSGHEHFNGSLVIPVVDLDGDVVEVYGRKISHMLRKGTPEHLYLPGPHAGVWNLPSLAASQEVIVCESLIDALTFWCAGFRNVTAAYGANGFTDEHHEALQAYNIERVLIAYDRDAAGDKAAAKLADRLLAEGIGCWRVVFPHGMDANELALKVTPARQSLDLLLRKATWMGEGEAPESSTTVSNLAVTHTTVVGVVESSESAKKKAAKPVEATSATPQPTAPQSSSPSSLAASAAAAAAAPPPAPPGAGLAAAHATGEGRRRAAGGAAEGGDHDGDAHDCGRRGRVVGASEDEGS
jgi:DNA primase catalytic core